MWSFIEIGQLVIEEWCGQERYRPSVTDGQTDTDTLTPIAYTCTLQTKIWGYNQSE